MQWITWKTKDEDGTVREHGLAVSAIRSSTYDPKTGELTVVITKEVIVKTQERKFSGVQAKTIRDQIRQLSITEG